MNVVHSFLYAILMQQELILVYVFSIKLGTILT